MFTNSIGKYNINYSELKDLNNRINDVNYNLTQINLDLSIADIYLNTHGLWYGGDVGANLATRLNTVTILNFRGDLINSERNVGTARNSPLGGGSSGIGMFYGGANTTTYLNIITRMNGYGYIIGSETNAGDLMGSQLSTAVVNNTMLTYGNSNNAGYLSGNGSNSTSNNFLQRFDFNGILLSRTSNNGTARFDASGVGFSNLTAMFYAGAISSDANNVLNLSNLITRFDSTGNYLSPETSFGIAAYEKSGCNIEEIGIYFGGTVVSVVGINILDRFNSNGTALSSETNIGTPRDSAAAASFKNLGVYYAGNPGNGSNFTNIVLRLDSLGTMIGLEFNTGTPRDNLGVASVNL